MSPLRSAAERSQRSRLPRFEHQCDLLLRMAGFDLGPGPFVVPGLGVAVDREATSPSGRVMWFAYRGSHRGARPGLRRTDAVRHAVATGALLRQASPARPFVVLTSHEPCGPSGRAMLAAARRAGYVDAVLCIYEQESQPALRGM